MLENQPRAHLVLKGAFVILSEMCRKLNLTDVIVDYYIKIHTSSSRM